MERLNERVLIWLAWKMPRGLVKWCAIRLGAHATQGPWSGQIYPELNFFDAIKRWDTATDD